MEFFKTLWNDMENIFGEKVSLGTNSVTTLNIIVWSLFIGFFIAIVFTLYNKLVIGSAVRKLLNKKAYCSNDALSASEIGCRSIFIRPAFRKNSTLRKILCTADGETGSVTSHNINTIKFFIPEESVKKAETIYGKKGIKVGNILLCILALVIVAMLAFVASKGLITMTGNFISGLRG